jgi:hypothetical protein
MPSFDRLRAISSPLRATALAAVLMLIGALVWFLPYVTRKQTWPAGVPDPPALFMVTEFALKPHGEACLSDVTIDADTRLAQIELRPKPPDKLGPPVDLVLTAGSYRGVMHVPGNYGGGIASLPVEPPPTTNLLGTACFVDVGSKPVLLDGTDETRTLSRSTTTVEGHPQPGDIALTFIDNRPHALLRKLGETFEHASNLTDRLVPVWLIWILAVLVAIGVPLGVLGAFYRALIEDEPPAPPQAP